MSRYEIERIDLDSIVSVVAAITTIIAAIVLLPTLRPPFSIYIFRAIGIEALLPVYDTIGYATTHYLILLATVFLASGLMAGAVVVLYNALASRIGGIEVELEVKGLPEDK